MQDTGQQALKTEVFIGLHMKYGEVQFLMDFVFVIIAIIQNASTLLIYLLELIKKIVPI